MSEVLLPPWIIPEKEEHEWLDEGSSVFASAFAPGLAQRQSYGGMRLRLKRRHTVRGEEKAVLLSVLKQTRGRFNALRTKVHFERRGSISSTEVLDNSFEDASQFTTSSDITKSVSDRIYRGTANANNGFAANLLRSVSPLTVTQYAPYVLRAYTSGRYSSAGVRVVFRNSAATAYVEGVGSTSTTLGYLRHSMVPPDASIHVSVSDPSSSGREAGQFVDIPYVSLSRCILVDNGLNDLLQSDTLENTSAWGATNSNGLSSVGANAETAPDGTTTADSIVEDTSTGQHYRSQTTTISSSVHDRVVYCYAKQGNTRTWCVLQQNVATGSVVQYFDLASGALGSSITGSGWSSLRAGIRSAGNGWYLCWMIARKTSANTSLTCRFGIANGDGGASYTGTTNGIYLWRCGGAASSVMVRPTQTTSAAATGTSQTKNALYVKGLPASTNGLLLPGDWFEINGELKQATAALNSDAAGLGYLQFEPALVRSPANDDPVIVTDPMGKFLVSNIRIENEFGTQAVVTYDLEHIYE